MEKAPSTEERATAERSMRRFGRAAAAGRQARWDALSMARQIKLLNEWNNYHPPRPGENPRDRVAARLEWAIETLEQRSM